MGQLGAIGLTFARIYPSEIARPSPSTSTLSDPVEG